MQKKISTRILLSISLFVLTCLVQSAWSLDQIIRPFQPIRSSGMGGVGLTTGLYEENFFGNPARMLANPENRLTLIDFLGEVGADAVSHVKDLTGDGDFYSKMSSTTGKNNHLRLQTSLPALYIAPKEDRWGFAFGVLMSTQVDIDLRNNFQIDPTAITDIGPAVTLGRRFLEDQSLGIGITAHATYRMATHRTFSLVELIKGKSIAPSSIGGQGTHLDFDLGTTYVLPLDLSSVKFTTAFAINNILGGKYQNLKFNPIPNIETAPPAQPRSYGFGISAAFSEFIGFTDTVFALEFRDFGNNPQGGFFRTVHAGAETRWGILIPRVGLNQGYLAAGLGIDLKILTLDFATYTEEMALNPGILGDRRYAAKIALQI